MLVTAVGEFCGPGEQGLLPASISGQPRTRYEELPLSGCVGKTARPCAARHPALIPRDEIKSRSQLFGEQPRPPRPFTQSVNAGLAGTSKIDEERTDSTARIGRGKFDHR